MSSARAGLGSVLRHVDPRRVASRARGLLNGGLGAFRQSGTPGLKAWVEDALYWRLDPWVRRWAAELPKQQLIDQEYDRRYGVDTAGQVDLSQVGIAPADLARGGSLYRPVWTGLFHRAIQAVPADLHTLTFLDYGSGKGKALLLASDYPFEEILGVEFAQPLHEIAQRNIAAFANPAQRCHRLQSLCGDAMQFAAPPTPLLCFFFNPFDDATMSVVLGHLRDSVLGNPRPVFVAYCNARNVREHERVFSAQPYLREAARDRQFLIYRVLAT